MSRLCGYPLANGETCAHRVADPAKPDCGRHHAMAAGEAAGFGPLDENGCRMRQVQSDVWRCGVHRGSAWEAAESLGAASPCRIPLPLELRLKLADRATDAHTIKLLARDSNASVRRRVAARLTLDPAERARLASDIDETVRTTVAQSLDLPMSVVEQLATDPCAAVQQQIVHRPPEHMSDRALWALSRSALAFIRAGLAGRPDIPADLLRHLAGDPALAIRFQVIQCPRTPLDALEQLAAHPATHGAALEAIRSRSR